jgi:hypothetical protein
MLLSTQLLGGPLARRHEQAALVRPSVGHKLSDTPNRPAALKLVENVDEMFSSRDAEQSARLHERVSTSKSLSTVRRAREDKVASANRGFSDRALDFPVINFQSARR